MVIIRKPMQNSNELVVVSVQRAVEKAQEIINFIL